MTSTKTPAEVQRDVDAIRNWMKKQPHLPSVEDNMLRRFLHSCYYSLESTKRCIELFFTIRAASPELLNKRDPLSPEIQKYLKVVNFASLPLKDKTNLLLWQLNDPGLEVYDYVGDARLFFLNSDLIILEDKPLMERDIVILDVKDISLKFLSKYNVSVAKKMTQYQQEAFPIRLKGVHVINAAPIIDKIFSLLKPFLKQEICEMIHFHAPNSDTLYKYLNKEELPKDYGGNAETMEDLSKEAVKRLIENRDFFLNDNLWKADESKRPKDNKFAQDSIQMNGSFRTLAID